MFRSAMLTIALAAAFPAVAQETRGLAQGVQSPPASIDRFAWLAGSWRGEGLGAPASETYSAPHAGSIAGHFVQEDGKGGIEFYELMQIVPRNGSLVYRLRHFGPDLKGWEDASGKPVEFPLVAIEGEAFYFDGLTLRREGADALTVWVKIGSKDGKPQEMPFRYRRTTP